jgi:hypothetical protein
MNRDYILFHLREGLEELERTVRELEQDQEYEQSEFMVAMEHLYHHLNTAWNARGSSPEAAHECSEADFHRWRQFPSDMSLDDGPGA